MVCYLKKEKEHIISKKEKPQNSKVPKFDLVRNVRDITLNFALVPVLKKNKPRNIILTLIHAVTFQERLLNKSV